jgi:hypothetical protein
MNKDNRCAASVLTPCILWMQPKKRNIEGKLKIPEVAYKYPSHVNSTDIRLKNKLPVLRQNIVPGYNLHCIDSVFGTYLKMTPQ